MCSQLSLLVSNLLRGFIQNPIYKLESFAEVFNRRLGDEEARSVGLFMYRSVF